MFKWLCKYKIIKHDWLFPYHIIYNPFEAKFIEVSDYICKRCGKVRSEEDD